MTSAVRVATSVLAAVALPTAMGCPSALAGSLSSEKTQVVSSLPDNKPGHNLEEGQKEQEGGTVYNQYVLKEIKGGRNKRRKIEGIGISLPSRY